MADSTNFANFPGSSRTWQTFGNFVAETETDSLDSPPSSSSCKSKFCSCMRKTASVVMSPVTSPANRLKEYMGNKMEDRYKRMGMDCPDNILLAYAKKPTWLKGDTLVFELTRGIWETDMNKLEKVGSFFTERNNGIGSWKMVENALYLTWPGRSQEETCIAATSGRQWVNKQSKLVIDVVEPKPDSPWWFTPSVVSETFQSESHVSSKNFECPVCYFELFRFPAAVVKKHSKRTCGHYFHAECATYLLKAYKKTFHGATCPICQVGYNEVMTMPCLMKKPREWFVTCDSDMGGELSESEVIEAVGSSLPVNRHKLKKNVQAHWNEWDPDGDGTITMQEFMMREKGLRDWVLKNLDQLQSVDGKKITIHTADIPQLDCEPKKWFDYWDKDKSGTLDKEELCRSLIRTFCVDDNGRPVLALAHDMREAAFSLWKALGYTPFAVVTFDEFVKPYGLMDQFLHNQTNCMYFGVDVENVAR